MRKFNYIYLITNKINGKFYIGKHSTDNLDDGYMGSGTLIKKAIIKYGIENFSKDYLAFCDTKEKLNWFEKFYIKKYKATEVGYNLTNGGDGGAGEGDKNSFYGKHHSEKTKQQISRALLGNVPWNKGKKNIYSQETLNKMSNSRKGKHYPKLSEAKKGQPSHNKNVSQPKYKWETPTGEIRIMDMANAHKHHPDWKKIEESF